MKKLLVIPIVFLILALSSFRRKFEITNIVNDLPQNGNWGKRDLSSISDITIHHSATKTGNAQSFANYHVNTKGWSGIGYHFVIDKNGNIEKTNELTAHSYHNGYNNRKAIGICFVGNFEIEKPTSAQIASGLYLVGKLKKDVASIQYLNGHNEYENATSCPGKYFDIPLFRRMSKLGNRMDVLSFSKSAFAQNFDKGSEFADN